jgi:pimeloyl-ACP methyl ester carboxylesterase
MYDARRLPRMRTDAERILPRARRLPAQFGAELYRDMARWDAEELETALAAVRAPMLVIQSTAMTPERRRYMLKAGESSPWLELLRSRVPGVRVEVIPGVGHFPQIEAAGEVSRRRGVELVAPVVLGEDNFHGFFEHRARRARAGAQPFLELGGLDVQECVPC